MWLHCISYATKQFRFMLFLNFFHVYTAVFHICYVRVQLHNRERKRKQIKVTSLSADAAHTKQKPSCPKSMVFLWIQATPCSPRTSPAAPPLHYIQPCWLFTRTLTISIGATCKIIFTQREFSSSSWYNHHDSTATCPTKRAAALNAGRGEDVWHRSVVAMYITWRPLRLW